MKLYIFLLLGVFLVFTNCEKEVQINLPKHKPSLVVNSLFSKDSVFKIHLSKTVSILNEFQSRIDNATVELFEDENLIEELYFDGETFNSTIFPKTGKRYKIKINTPEFQQVFAEDYIPSQPNLISSSFKDNVYTDADGFGMSQAKIEIQDEPNEQNYYELILVTRNLVSFPGSDENNIVSYDMTNNDPVLLNEDILSYYPEYLIFSDKLFDGKIYTLNVNYGSSTYNGEIPNNELIIYLRCISENYYNFKKRLIVHLYNQDSDIWDGLGQPVPAYTNINNGFGIFAGYSQLKKIIQLSKDHE